MSIPAPPDWEWLEIGLASGDVLVLRSDAREHILYFVRADRDGLMTRRLLTYTTDGRVSVRRKVFELLDQLRFEKFDWPLVADAAEPALRDEDPQVRRTAAALLVNTGESERAMAVLNVSTDPVVRVALADALLRRGALRNQSTLERLRSDPVPAIRLLANVAAYRNDDPVAWPVLDLAIRADLKACDGVLDAPTAAQHWAAALTRLDREEDCCAWAERLASPAEGPQVRLEGVRMALAAMRAWRSAPTRITPMLTGLLREERSEAALHALAASETACRLAADDLAAVLDDRDLGTVAAIALGTVGDHRAVPHLVRLMLSGSEEPGLAEAFRAVAQAGADPEAPVAAARQVLAAHPDSYAPELPMRVLAAFGPAAAAAVPELIARLEGAENDTPDLTFFVLGRIGPAAAAAIPSLRQYNAHGAKAALLKVDARSMSTDRTGRTCAGFALPSRLPPGQGDNGTPARARTKP